MRMDDAVLNAWSHLKALGCTRVDRAVPEGVEYLQIVELHCGGRRVGYGEHRWAHRAFLRAVMEAVQIVCPDGCPATPVTTHGFPLHGHHTSQRAAPRGSVQG